ncbi:MAG: MFS transporter [Oscillospiraceae bacterium]|nr:MFS transporter [Oscillospiraceae bacterium]
MSKSMESDILSTKEKLYFGIGDFCCGNFGLFMNIVYFKFLTDIIMIPAGVAGTIVLVTKFWDAIINPFVGIFSDNTRSKWGRRRPVIFAGAFFLVAAMGLVFMPIQNFAYVGKIIYVTASWMFFCTVTTFIHISYAALSGEISNDYRQRNAANTIRLAISLVSTLICATAPLILRDMMTPIIGQEQAYLVMGLVFGILFGIALILTAIHTKERVPIPIEKTKFVWKNFIKPLKIKCFRELLLFYAFAFLALDIVTTLFQHFMQYVAHREAETSFVLGALVIAQIIAVPVMYSMTKRVSKPFIFCVSVPIWVVGAFCLSFYSANWDSWLIYAFAAITGIGVCGCVMMPWLLFPDAADVGELSFGSRDTGAFSAVMIFMRQLSAAFGVACIGWIMEWTGYDVNLGTYGQPESAITGFRGIIIISTALFLGLAFFFASRSKLNEKNSLIIRRALACTREGKLLDNELQEEINALKPSLIGK